MAELIRMAQILAVFHADVYAGLVPSTPPFQGTLQLVLKGSSRGKRGGRAEGLKA